MLLRIATILALAALAIGTWILSNQSRLPRSTPRAAQAQLPGYYLTGTVMTDYNLAGFPGVRIAAERIEQIGQSTDVALHNVRLDYQTDGGQQWVLVGDTAHVEQSGNIVEVNGNVQLQGLEQSRPDPAIVRTDQMTYDVPAAEVHTGNDVSISFGENKLNAHGLVVRLKERTMRLESKVYGRFTP